MWSVMKCFGYDSLPEELNSPNVHRLENVMTLVPGLRVEFDRLGLWFVATVRSTLPWIFLLC
jgi:hypothetical protein